MNYKNYTDVKHKTINAQTPEELDMQLERLSMQYDFIDIQFAITNDWYTVFVILKIKKD